MDIKIAHPNGHCEGSINITGSKSETNRLLLLQALFNGFELKNTSNSDDSKVMQKALQTSSDRIDIHHAGTAMRFLTAYFSHIQGRSVVLTGSSRMQERPIQILVDALRDIGASISYEKEEGFPPLKIHGKKLAGGKVELPADVSSQYISALLLLGPVLEQGLELHLVGKITSIPYIDMTLSLLNSLGVSTSFEGQLICVSPMKEIKKDIQIVESDWSSASYFFSIAALSETAEIHLTSFRKESLQGDSVLRSIYDNLNVSSHFEGDTLILKKENKPLPTSLKLDLSKAPDIAQTIAVSCYGLGIGCDLVGLHTLKIKETDRLEALNTELSKLGATIKVTENSLHLSPGINFKENCSIPTYNDHRMAMAFAPLALKIPLQIEASDVVSKSYPDFWKDMKKLNFQLN
ncbi:3-phosphoshikimate 1-carboxyvinyltransferase [Flavobacteriaceae bacterium]|jgi:3-phosphoshikimate 1-carboxyvinyltransferase|nr:3-phosphoshikimate 1-carboxyvinyltransferase [Flavobacteriaceae bacterium]MBT7675455.1 3-phosphoshikimate 1-carboxyvinyltransferase [Flavobacteriaceae bacterium]MDA7765644.1 3-phosphoshikimate 1-carboxyvinyltransferase [Flavobacteriaceae bacterium]MDB4128811.1 3-phosphoshikimate 1-carboxyvinyltransferase [Flavobacteriaceae bacterium]MDC0103115.1 3-phosphoshikimate 1-carboxyvinyltransferase [Flavobacteriaceae bacterium]